MKIHIFIVTAMMAAATQAQMTTADSDKMMSASCNALAALLSTTSVIASATTAAGCTTTGQIARDKIGTLIDDYFDSDDQEFVNETCSTIKYSDGRILKPTIDCQP